METMKTTPKGVSSISGMVRLADGSIAFIDENSGIMYRSKDNADSWEEREISPLSENCGIEEVDITSRAIAPDGGVFYSYVDWKEDFNAEDSASSPAAGVLFPSLPQPAVPIKITPASKAAAVRFHMFVFMNNLLFIYFVCMSVSGKSLIYL